MACALCVLPCLRCHSNQKLSAGKGDLDADKSGLQVGLVLGITGRTRKPQKQPEFPNSDKKKAGGHVQRKHAWTAWTQPFKMLMIWT